MSVANSAPPNNPKPLQANQRFVMGGHNWRVIYVSPCRAHCVAFVLEPVTIHERDGRTRTFTAKRRIHIDISPNSAVDLFAELERSR